MFRLSILISRLNSARRQRIDSFNTIYSNINLAFADKLEKLGIIRGFEVKNDKLWIYMKYVNKSVPFVNIRIVSKPSRRYPVTIQKLIKIADRNGSSIFIISTGYGLLSHTECFVSRCSGQIIAKIDL